MFQYMMTMNGRNFEIKSSVELTQTQQQAEVLKNIQFMAPDKKKLQFMAQKLQFMMDNQFQ